MTNLSIIVVNYNGGARILENLRLILRDASALGGEVVVVDNASDDGSAERILEQLPGVRILRERENGGYARGVNRGLEHAAGAVLVVLNPDVVPREGALARLTEAVRDRPEFGLLGGLVLDRAGRPDPNAFRALPRVSAILREGVFLRPRTKLVPTAPRTGRASGARPDASGVAETEAISGSVMALTRESLATLGPMDGGFFLYNEDVEWCRRAARKKLKVGVVRGAVFSHDGGTSTGANEGQAFAARVLSDFLYFCEGDGVSAATVRRLWRARLALRSWLYGADSIVGARARRRTSRRRAATYRLLGHALRGFEWSTGEDVQPAHPFRLLDLPSLSPRGPGDERPVVLQVVPNLEYGGTQRLIESLAAGPLTKHYRLEILCLTHLGEIGERLKACGLAVHLAGMSGWRRPLEWRRAADVATLLGPDLVHSHLLPGDVAAWLAFRGLLPIVSTKHGVDGDMPWWARFVEWFVLRRATAILAVSDAAAAAKSYLGRDGMLPPVVQSPPTVASAPSPAPLFVPGRKVRLAIVGRLHPVKRVDLFLETAAELERRSPGTFEFRVVGTGPEEPRLRARSRELGLGDAVEFRGGVHDVAAELDEVDIVLLLSEHEGLGLTILEALARGRIPVVRRVPGADEALPPALRECFVDSSRPADFAGKVLEICDHRARFAGLAARGRAWLSGRHDYASTMRTVYDAALRGGRPASRVRVLHLITRLIVGGAQENTIASVARVDPEHCESHLWIGPQTGSEGSLRDEARERGILVRVLPNMVREVSPWKDLLVTFELIRLLRRGRFDIVHTHSSKAGITGRIAARLAGVPHIVHTVHGWGFHDRMHPLVRRIYVLLERTMEPWTRPLVAVSNRTIRIGLDERIGRQDSYRLIRSGIPLASFYPDADVRARVRADLGVRDGELLVGSVGRLSEQKNPLDFVRVAARLLDKHKAVRLLYVGDGPLRNVVERAVAEAGIGDRVLLPGIRDDVPDLLRAMDVMVMTSLWEGLPRVVPQALATGVPVVSYDVSGIDECVIDGRNGYRVPVGDVEAMAARLARLLEDTPIRAEMGRRAREELDPAFAEDAMIAAIERLYRDIMSGALDARDRG